MEKKDVYELTNPQKNIWSTEQYFSGTNINNVCGRANITEKVDFAVLKDAIQVVLKTNSSFLINFKLIDGELFQHITPYHFFDIKIIDVKTEKDVKELENKLISKVYKLEDKYLYNTVIYRFPNQTGGFFLNTHHLLGDSWSLGLYCRKVITAYKWLLENNKTAEDVDINAIPGMTSNYIDYCKTEKEYLNSPKFEKDKQYWNEKFETVPEVASLPSKSNKTTNLSCKGNRQKFEFSKETSAKINEYCKTNNISNFNFITAIYSLYISRCCNLDDFVIGTPLLNRSNFAEKNTEGMFVSTAPLRINLKEATTFLCLAKNIAKNSMGMLRHQKYPYEYLLKDLRKKEPNLPNLYNILISYQITKTTIEGLKHDTYWAFNGNCADELQIHILDLNDFGTLNISYDYKKEKFEDQEIIDLHKRIEHIVNQILDNNKIELNNIEIVTEEEKNEILNTFNNTNVDFPRNKTIVNLFEEQVEKTPNNIAVVFEDKSLTYKELNEKANQLAHYLINNNLKPRTVVGLRLNKRFEMIIGILAIIKAGCCYLPINMQYPEDRVQFMLKDSNSKLLLGTTNSLNDMNLDIQKINIELTNSKIYETNTQNPNLKITPEDLIYIIYTSGSTGTPKGAMLCHRNVVRLFKNNKFQFNFDENDSWTMFHSVAFDFSVWEMYGALLFGGKLVLVPDEVAQDPILFLDLMRKENVTILNQTPTYFYKLQKAEMMQKDANLKVRYIVYGGEALKPNLIQDWHTKYPNCKLINMYGITETTVHVTFKELKEEDLKSPSSNIGTPIPTLGVIIVDKSMNLLPYGVEGEMCVLGEGVFKGYLNREDLNKTKLIINKKYSNTPIYKSGDTAIMHKEGFLEYLGRIDTQVKIRGFRIELGEIEEKICKYANIETCIVTKKIDENAREMLCAYYIKNGPINISNLRIILNKHLPNYMIPQYFIEIDKVPININGKTDFKALPLPKISETSKNAIPARNKIDKTLLEIYEKALHAENISIADSFFDLGGDSLTAINISEAINRILNTNIKVKDVIENDIIKNLSDYISSNDIKKTNQIQIKPAKMQEYYPLSSAQKRIYYTDKMIGENNLVYNTPGAILIDKILDKDKVQKVFNKIIEKQSSFRTSFEIYNDEIIQKIHNNITIDIPTFNSKEEDINTIIESFPKAFNLEKAPLIRVELHYIDNKKTLLLLDSHHIVMDGASLTTLIEEFFKLYNNEKLEAPIIEYKDYAVWENNYLSSSEIETAEKYWVNKLQSAEYESLNLPYDFNIPNNRTYEGNTISNIIEKENFAKYISFAKNVGISPYMLFISAFFVLLYKYTGQEEIMLGTPTSGRINSQLKDIIGMFVNNLVVYGKIDSNEKFTSFAQSIKEQISNDLTHQEYPYDLLVKKLNITSNPGENPLFDVMFTYQNNEMSKFNIDGSNAELIKCLPNISKFNLSIEIEPKDYKINIEYRTDLFKEETINRLFEHYINTLNKIVNNQDITIKDISIISDEEKDLILNKFNDTKIDYQDTNIIKLFEKQVQENPDKIAIIFENKKITYKELNKRINNFANYLNFIGATSNDNIAITLNRSIELIISIYSVIKLGASYILIDPSLPQKRIDYIVNDCKAKYCITNNSTKNTINSENIINIDNFDFKNYTNTNTFKNANTDNLCIIYTSGSTGKPKGVLLHKHGFVNLIFAFNKEMKIADYSSMLGIASVSFDMFAVELFCTTLLGNTLVLANEEEQKNPIAMSDLIIKNNVEFMITTPSRIELLLDEQCNNPLKQLKAFQLGGEKLTASLYTKLRKSTNAKIFNGYGPTEITACCTNKLITSNKITIGKPLQNIQVYICNKDMNLLPNGITGEICISGKGITNGYLNNNTATNNNFIKNPFGEGNLYKTGDLGKYTPNGEIEYLGRTDFQIKIRGLRVELSEIETTLNSLNTIEASVVLYNSKDKFPYLIAFVTSNDIINVHNIKTSLEKKLPNYMIPRYIIQLNNFPITLNGKIDKKALENYQFETDNPNINNYVSPKTETQKLFCNIWSSLLNIEVGIDDDLFNIGADSLLAIKFKTKLLSHNIDLPYADIFKYRTIRKLCSISTQTDNTPNSNIEEYEKINKLLKTQNDNIIENASGNVLLLGGTGFIGMHIINSFIKNCKGKIYCIVREKNKISSLVRFTEILHFYFGTKLDKYINNRIFILNGNILKENFDLSNKNYNLISQDIDTVINSAANVKHYGNKDNFKEINTDSLNIMINFCKNFNKRLIHISTLSISGNMLMSNKSANKNKFTQKDFTEKDFYIGQALDNVYTKSKFEAEKIIFNEIITNHLNAQIVRLGNITNRYSDGQFQINPENNAFANRIKTFIKIKQIPEYLLNDYLEFTPVDLCSDAIINILNNNSKNRYVYHIYNDNHVQISELINYLKKLNYEISVVPENEFLKNINEIIQNSPPDYLSGIINDFDISKKINYSTYIKILGENSKNILEKHSFIWPKITIDYIKKCLNQMGKNN